LILLAVFGLLMAALAWLVPYVLTSAVPNWLKDKTTRELKVAEASFNPFTLRLIAKKITLNDASRPLASVAGVEVKGSWASLTNLAWTTDSITVNKPEINARIGNDGSLDWVRFLDAFPKSKEPPGDTVPRILLHNISIENGAVRLSDDRLGATERRLDLTPLTFKLDKLSTLPRDAGDYALQATLNDQTRVQWKGRVGLNPIESSGDLAISNLPLARVQSLANLKLPVAIEGVADVTANYSAAVGVNFVSAGIGGGTLALRNLRATQNRDEASIASVKLSPLSASWAKTSASGRDEQVFALLPLSANINGISVRANGQKDALLGITQIATTQPVSIDIAARKVEVPQITLTGMQLAVERARDGAVVLPFAAPPAAAPVAPVVPSSTAATAAPPPSPATAAVASTATLPSPWRINFAEISTEKAALALRDQSFVTPQTAITKLDLTAGAVIEAADKLGLRVSGKRISFTDVAVRDESASQPWLTVKETRAAPFETDALSPKIELPKIDIVSPLVSLVLNKDGLDVARKLTPAIVAATSAKAANSATTTPKISIVGVSVNGGRANLVDNTLPAAITHVVDAIKLTTERIEVDGSRPLSALLNATLASGGAMQAKLKFDQRRNDGEADITLERVALAALSPYLNRNTRLKLTKGEASIAGRAKFSTMASAPEALRFEGNTAVRDLELIDETTQLPFVQWAELSSQDLKISQGSAGLNVTLADLLLDQPRGKLIISENGTVNLTQIGKIDPATGAAPVQAVKPAESAPMPGDSEKQVRVKVDRLQVTGGDVEFADLSLRPQFGTRVSNLSGLIVGLSTEPSSRAEVSMEGKVDEFGLARLSGNLSPLGATEYTDLKAIFRNLEMKNLTPYSGKFAGRKIESGKLSLDLEYKIVARKLKGENQVIIDNLTLGEKVDSKDATNLPLDLAIALLRDSKGVIDLGLPVQGSLDDPQFSYGSLIWKTIVNVLTKIVTAPFRALGALLGGSGEEFEAVIFEPGEARLLPPEREKLAKLAKALEQRPQLKLTVEGRFDKERDREALADNIVKLEVSKRAGMKPPAANEPLIISFTDAKVQTALDELAAAAGDDAAKLRAQYLPPAGNAVTGLLQNAREKLTEKGRNEATEARAKYYPELFKLLRTKQAVPDIAYATLAGFRAEAVKNTLTAVNKFDAARVSVAVPQAVKSSKADQVATTLALSVK
jgi:Domain of Unknown Function (DUF748)